MEDMMKKRKRTENYTFEETLKLLECVRKYQHIVENKKTNSFTWRQKDQTWERISQEYNSSNSNKRTTKMLRGKFETLKKEARKYTTAQRQADGNAPIKIKSNLVLDMVQEIMSIECPPSVLDTDKMPDVPGIGAESNADSSCVAAEATPELLSFKMDVPVVSTGNLSCHTNVPSKDDQKLSSHVAEKVNVTTLQQQLLREQFAQREKRDQEIHEFNMQIKKTELEIKQAELINLGLDIKIKKKSIKKLLDVQ